MVYLALIITLILMVIGANGLVNASITLARRFHISEFVIGALIVGVGTSLPELAVSVYGAIQGNSDVAIGNVVGSNIFNILGILGITTLVYPIMVKHETIKTDLAFMLLSALLLPLLMFDITPNILNRWEGLILLFFMGGYIFLSYKNSKSDTPTEDITDDNTPIYSLIPQIIGGLMLLILSASSFVDNAVTLAQNLGMSEAFISLTIIACGTSLPELMASLIAAIKKNSNIALGNIVGSNIFNILGILGIATQIKPLTSGGITLFDYRSMIISATALTLIACTNKIPRWIGLIFLIAFICYTYQIA